MIVEDDLPSGGIEFACTSSEDIPEFEVKKKFSIFEDEIKKVPMSLDHNNASSTIRSHYKILRLFILT